jgi:NitT/TauT family transport system ATP-binding protein
VKLKLDGVAKAYNGYSVFDGLDCDFEAGSITVVLGPSGCGKTTLLNLLAGLIRPDSGTVRAEGTVSYLFQEPRLLPWKTVEKNLDFILPEAVPKDERRLLVDRMLDIVELADFKQLYPSELSGGMRQRVAMARAFLYRSDILLMDEPFQALDLSLRISLVEAFRNLWEQDPRTTIFVTHDIQEALMLADRILVFSRPPVRIVADRGLALPKSERLLGGEELMPMEKFLYEILAAKT